MTMIQLPALYLKAKHFGNTQIHRYCFRFSFQAHGSALKTCRFNRRKLQKLFPLDHEKKRITEFNYTQRVKGPRINVASPELGCTKHNLATIGINNSHDYCIDSCRFDILCPQMVQKFLLAINLEIEMSCV